MGFIKHFSDDYACTVLEENDIPDTKPIIDRPSRVKRGKYRILKKELVRIDSVKPVVIKDYQFDVQISDQYEIFGFVGRKPWVTIQSVSTEALAKSVIDLLIKKDAIGESNEEIIN